MVVRVQQADFDVGHELDALRAGRRDLGAIVTFIGLVRDMGGAVATMDLEHYPGMTEAALRRIETEALRRWPLEASLIVHRVGRLAAGDQIVLVATASAHREAAFEAAAFLMDFLKTDAPFWKKESGPDGAHWVEAKAADEEAQRRWLAPGG